MEIKRIVVKIGTSTVAHSTCLPNISQIEDIVKVLANVKNMGKEVIIVTSGAVGIGAGKLGFSSPPKKISQRQACAAVGQVTLMEMYGRMFSYYGYMVSQILLTHKVLDGAENELNTKNTFYELLNRNIIPIVNANDTISTSEVEFGDNDILSAAVSVLVGASVLVILTDLDGVFNCNPKKNPSAKLIKYINNIDGKLKSCASGNSNALGTGGMVSKLNAAEFISSKNIPTVIVNGAHPERIYGVFEKKIEGTLIDLNNSFKLEGEFENGN